MDLKQSKRNNDEYRSDISFEIIVIENQKSLTY